MKLISKIFILLALTFASLSCNEALTSDPTTSFTRDEVYGTKAGFESALLGCQIGFRQCKTNVYTYLGMVSGMHVYGSGYSTKQSWLQTFKLVFFPNESTLSSIYTGYYQAVAYANDFIEAVEEGGDLVEEDQEYYNSLKGEALIIRALMMFNAVRLWGDVPVYREKVTSLADTYKKFTPFEQVYEYILEDLTLAEELCYDKDQVAQGHYSKWVATALKAKVYTHMACIFKFFGEPFELDLDEVDGVWYDVTTEDEAWAKVIEYGLSVEKDGPFELVADYNELFDWSVSPVWYSPEAIITAQGTDDAGNSQLTSHTMPEYYIGCPNLTSSSSDGRRRPQRESLLRHLQAHSDTEFTSLLYATSDPREDKTKDPRIDATFIYYNYTENATDDAIESSGYANRERTIFPTDGCGTGDMYRNPFLNKYTDANYTSSGSGNANLYIYRYADLLLLIAEAYAELGEKALAVEYVNKVLTRARNSYEGGALHPINWKVTDYSTDEDLVYAIMEERMFELFSENHEWYDTRRRGIAFFKEFVSDYHNDYLYGNVYKGIEPQTEDIWADYGGETARYPETDNAILIRLLLAYPEDELTNNTYLSSSDQNYGYSDGSIYDEY